MSIFKNILNFLVDPAQTAKNTVLEHKNQSAFFAFFNNGQPVWTRFDNTNYALEGYEMNPIVYACIKLLAENAAKIPIYVQNSDDNHPVLKLLQKPNPLQNREDFFITLISYLSLYGDSFIERVETSMQSKIELYLLRPERVKIIPNKKGWVAAYEYALNGRSRQIAPQNMLHIKTFSPLDDFYGLSPLQAAAKSIDIHNSASSYQKNLLDNAARPSGCLVYNSNTMGQGTTMNQEQFLRLKVELEKQYSGANNAGRPMLLEGGLEWKQMSFTPVDMEFLNMKHAAAREIALCFNVPPMLLGIPGDNTYSNYQEANRAFIRQAILPILDKILSHLSQFLGASLLYDTDSLPALLPEREALWRSVSTATFLSDTEKRELLNL